MLMFTYEYFLDYWHSEYIFSPHTNFRAEKYICPFMKERLKSDGSCRNGSSTWRYNKIQLPDIRNIHN